MAISNLFFKNIVCVTIEIIKLPCKTTRFAYSFVLYIRYYHDKKWPIVLTYETLDIQDSPDHMVVEESETKSKCFCCCQCCEKIAKYLNSLINY